MQIDPPEDHSNKAEQLRQLTTKGPLPSSVAKLSGSSRGIPTGRDFHFYYNFDEFKKPVRESEAKSKKILENVGTSSRLWEASMAFPEVDPDLDEEAAYDWLVNVNDALLEGVDSSIDEFKGLRKKEEESGVRVMRVGGSVDDENGFQVVYGKKSRRGGIDSGGVEGRGEEKLEGVKVAAKPKPKVPFHIPTIPRPQDEYRIIVNNVNQPFEHVWLLKSDDGSRFIHPLEKFSPQDFVDSIPVAEPVKPPLMESTPFKLVEEVKDLKLLATKLRDVDEFAVDLEHNQYRSFQGLTCLMQISTRTEDFIVDTLKLRIHVGPYLRELFKDPTKKKVMHGADRDIVWLQRDFGIYVCNMFDTGQASRVLKMERNSLEYLLHHFCGVTAKKEYQNADWRLRPLPSVMVKYAREDTHYLLYIYDQMKTKLFSSTIETESSDPPIVEVYKRSYDICMRLYEKELLTDTSYLHIYGVHDTDLNAQQLAVVAGLCEWRDVVARAEDESTGYILPNKTLIEIAKQMPLTTSKLRRCLKSRHSYLEKNLGAVVSIIRHSIQNAAAFEAAVEYLKERRMEMAVETNNAAVDESEVLPPESPETGKTALEAENESTGLGDSITRLDSAENLAEHGSVATVVDEFPAAGPTEASVSRHTSSTQTDVNPSYGAEVTIQALKKPSRAFGALLGPSAKRKYPSGKTEELAKLEQIKSSVNLPFHAFRGEDEQLLAANDESAQSPEISHLEKTAPVAAQSAKMEDLIRLGDDSDTEEPANTTESPTNDVLEHGEIGALEVDGDETMSLSDLSSSFQKCFQSTNQASKAKEDEKSRHSNEAILQLKSFDYEAARKEVRFGGDPRKGKREVDDGNTGGRSDRGNRKKSSVKGESDGTGDLPQGRRRQAFPASGNRSYTYN